MASRPTRTRLLAVAAGLVATVVLGIVGVHLAVDRWHLEDRIVNGGRIRHCWLLGGSYPAEFHEVVDLDAGLAVTDFGRIIEDGHDIVVARVVRRDDRTTVGYGAWNVGDGESDPLAGAVDALARRVSGADSTLDERDVRSQIRAGRECSERGIPG